MQGDEFDAVMNYLFAQAAQDFFVDEKTQIKPSDFATRLSRIVYNYPLQVSFSQQNLFDSHDTDRVASMFMNPDLSYDGPNRLQDPGTVYDFGKPSEAAYQRMLQAFAFQMTFVGAPMIYYGNEAGMYSADDPSNRQPMTWPGMVFDNPDVGFNRSVFEGTQKLIAVRRALPALRTGLYRTTVVDDVNNVFGFVRSLDGENVYVVVNRSDAEQTVRVPIIDADRNQLFVNLLGEDQIELEMFDAVDARPSVRLTELVKLLEATDGVIDLQLGAYETAVLASKLSVE